MLPLTNHSLTSSSEAIQYSIPSPLPEVPQLAKDPPSVHQIFSCCNLGSIGAKNIASNQSIPLFINALEKILSAEDPLPAPEVNTLHKLKSLYTKTLQIDEYISSHLFACKTSDEYILRRNILVTDTFQYLETHRICYFPCAYDTEYGGHLIFIKFTLDEQNDVQAEFCNTGDCASLQGILFDSSEAPNKTLSTVRLPKIPLDSLKNSSFLSCLCSLNRTCCFDAPANTSSLRAKTSYRGSTDFFDTTLHQWEMISQEPAEVLQNCRGLQRGDTCSLKPVILPLRDLAISRKTEKRIKLQMRCLSLENLLDTPNVTPYHTFQIQWTLAKISKTCLQLGSQLPTTEYERALRLISRGEDAIQQLKLLENKRSLELFKTLLTSTDPISFTSPTMDSSGWYEESVLTSASSGNSNTSSGGLFETLQQQPLATEWKISPVGNSFLNAISGASKRWITCDAIAVTANALAMLIRFRMAHDEEVNELLEIHLNTLRNLITKSWKQIRIFRPENEEFFHAFIQVLDAYTSSCPENAKIASISSDCIQFPPIFDRQIDQHPILQKCLEPSLWWEETYAQAKPYNGSLPDAQQLFFDMVEEQPKLHQALWRAHVFNTVEFREMMPSEYSVTSILIQNLISALLLRNFSHSCGVIHMNICDLSRGEFVCQYQLQGNRKNCSLPMIQDVNEGIFCDQIYPFNQAEEQIFYPIFDDRLLPPTENQRVHACYVDSNEQRERNLAALQISQEEYCLLTLAGMYDDLSLPLWMYYLACHDEKLQIPLFGACTEAFLLNRRTDGPSLLQWALTGDTISHTGDHLLFFLGSKLEQIADNPSKGQTRRTLLRVLARSYDLLARELKKNPQKATSLRKRLELAESLLSHHIKNSLLTPFDQITLLSLYPYIRGNSSFLQSLSSRLVDQSLMSGQAMLYMEKESLRCKMDIEEGIDHFSNQELPKDRLPYYMFRKIQSSLIDKSHQVQLSEEEPPTYEFIDGGISTRITVTSPTTYILEKELTPGQWYRYHEKLHEKQEMQCFSTLLANGDFESQPLDCWIHPEGTALIYPRGNLSTLICSMKSGEVRKGDEPELSLVLLDKEKHKDPFLQRLFCIENPQDILAWKDDQGNLQLLEFPKYQFQLRKAQETDRWNFIHSQFPDATVDFTSPCQEMIPFSHYLIVKTSGKNILVMPNTLFPSTSIDTFRDDTYIKGIQNNTPQLLQWELDDSNHLIDPSQPALILHLFFLSLYAHEYERAEKLLAKLSLHRFLWGKEEDEVLHGFLYQHGCDEHPYACHLRIKLLELKNEFGSPLTPREHRLLNSQRSSQSQLFSHGLIQHAPPLLMNVCFSPPEPNIAQPLCTYSEQAKQMTTLSPPEQPLPLRYNTNFFILYFPFLFAMATSNNPKERQELRDILFRTQHQRLPYQESFYYSLLLKMSNLPEAGSEYYPLNHTSVESLVQLLTDPKTHEREIDKRLTRLYNLISEEDISCEFPRFSPRRPLIISACPSKQPLVKMHKQLEESIDIPSDFDFSDDPDLSQFVSICTPQTPKALCSEEREEKKEELLRFCSDYALLPPNHQRLRIKIAEQLKLYFENLQTDVTTIEQINRMDQFLKKEISFQFSQMLEAKNEFMNILNNYEDTKLQLQLHVGLLKKMTEEEILIAFARNDDQKFLDSNPSLTTEDLESIKLNIAEYLKARTTRAHLLRTRNTLLAYTHSSGEEQKNAARQFYECLSSQRGYNTETISYEALLVFEALSNKRLRKEQVDRLLQMTESNRVELEARTGFGKSEVLIPLWLFLTCKNHPNALTVMVVPSSLLSDQEDRLKKILGNTFHQGIHRVTFSREQSFNLSAVRNIYKELCDDITKNTIILTDIRSFHGLINTALKTALHRETSEPSLQGQELLEELWKLSLLLRNNSRVFIDESAECVDPRNYYSYALDSPSHVTKKQCEEMQSFWENIFLDPLIQQKWEFDCSSNPMEQTFSKIPLTDDNFKDFQLDLAKIAVKKLLPEEEDPQPFIEHLVGGKATEQVIASLEALGTERKSLYASHRYQIFILRHSLLKKLGDHYDLDNNLHAVPLDRGEIKPGSIFSNIYETLNYTIQANLKRDVSEETVQCFIREIKNPHSSTFSNPADFTKFWEGIRREYAELPNISYINESHISHITRTINQNKKLKIEFITYYILPRITFFPLQASGTSFNLLNLLKHVLLASGTPNADSLPPDIHSLADHTGSSLSSFVAIYQHSHLQCIDSDPKTAFSSLLEDPSYRYDASPPVLIDVAGTFSQLSEEEICELFFSRNPYIKGVCYYVTEKGPNKEPLSICKLRIRGSDHSLLRKDCTLNPKEIGIFIKQGSIIGTDLPIPETARGYVTLDHMTSLSDLLQGSSRLRALKHGQTVHLALTQKTATIIEQKLAHPTLSLDLLFSYLFTMEAERKGNDYFFCLELLLQSLIENNLWAVQDNLEELKERFAQMKDLLISSNTLDPLDVMYRDMVAIEARSAIACLKESILNKARNKRLSYIDIENIERTFMELIDYEKLPEILLTRGSAINTSEVEEENELEQEEELEQQNEMSTAEFSEWNSFVPASLQSWDGDYTKLFQKKAPDDHFLGIDVYHSPNFPILATTTDTVYHKAPYFYLLQQSPNGVKILALDLYDTNLIFRKIKTNPERENKYYLICDKKILAHNHKEDSIPLFLSHPEADKISLFNKILTRNPRLTREEKDILQHASAEELACIQSLIKKYQRAKPVHSKYVDGLTQSP